MLKLRQPCYGTGDGFGGGGFGSNDSNASDTGENSGFGGDSGSNTDTSSNDTSWGGFKDIETNLGLNDFDASALDSLANSIGEHGSYVDGWASVKYGFVDFQNQTNMSITENPDGSYSFYADRPNWGFLNDETAYQEGNSTVYGGTISAGLANIGVSIQTSITLENVAQAGVALALGSPIAAIAPTAKALQAQGVIDQQTSNAIQAAGALASFAQGMLNGIQALDAINTAKNYGAINDIEAGLMAAATVYGMISGVQGFSAQMDNLGFGGVSTADMRDFGVSSDGDRTYIRGSEVTLDNLQSYMSSFALYIANKNRADGLKEDIFGRMAGSYFYNNLAAGGSLFSAIIPQTTNLIASVGKDLQYPMFAQMSILQENFLGISRNAYRAIAKA